VELPDILTEKNVEKAAELVRRYYLVPDSKTGLLGTGSHFDTWAADDAAAHPNEITDSDLVAVSLLTVSVSGKAAMGLRAAKAGIISLLTDIPNNRSLHSVPAEQRELIIGTVPRPGNSGHFSSARGTRSGESVQRRRAKYWPGNAPSSSRSLTP
jgi:hypothetical protein